MAEVVHVLARLNAGAALGAVDTAILAHPHTSSPIKATVLARLLHRTPTAEHIELKNHLSAQLPDITSALHEAFPPEQSEGHCIGGNSFVRVLRAAWADSLQRRQDLRAFVSDIVNDRVSTEQVAAWLGTVVERGLPPDALIDLTHAMRDSGKVYDYRGSPCLAGRKLIRRYPTGGLSEKVALVLPSVLVVAAARYPIASNFLVARSLGFTGGTWDKLSSIPGFRFAKSFSTQSYFHEAAVQLAAERAIRLVTFRQEFETVEKASDRLHCILRQEGILS